jgi:hypothetical protein
MYEQAFDGITRSLGPDHKFISSTTVVGQYIRTPTLVLLYQNRLFTDIPATKILLKLTVATLLLSMAYYGILRCRHSTMAYYGILRCRHSNMAYYGILRCRHSTMAYYGILRCSTDSIDSIYILQILRNLQSIILLLYIHGY